MSLVLFDLDGVLVDMIGGVAVLFGVSGEDVLRSWTPGEYDILPAIQRAVSLSGSVGLDTPSSESSIWRKIDACGEDFWKTLIPHEDGIDLLNCVIEAGHECAICSTPSAHHSSAAGKVAWIQTWIPKMRRRFVLTPMKHLLAKPGVVLIDDHDKNVEAFRAAGGEADLVPRPWNSAHAVTPHGCSVDSLTLMRTLLPTMWR